MTGTAFAELSTEIDAAVRDGSPARRARMLARIVAFFVAQADRLNPAQLSVFDDILVRLLPRADARMLTELSTALGEMRPGPELTVRSLASHDNAAVAAPVLGGSASLSDADLIGIASHHSQQHLVAIARREQLSEAVSEAILRHSGKDATRALLKNPGARFSAAGYATLLAMAARDETIAESLGSRTEIPVETLRILLANTTDVVRTRLLKASPPAIRERVRLALDAIPVPAARQAPDHDDLANARAAIVALNKSGKLNDSTVNRFAIRREYPNVIAALVLLSGADVDNIAPLMDEESGGGLMIACRASRLNWQTTRAVLNNRRVPPLSEQQLDQASEVFEMLLVSSAQYTIRFEPPRPAADRSGANGRVAKRGVHR
jgi:uncharacterized protein (DUF2336 family)